MVLNINWICVHSEIININLNIVTGDYVCGFYEEEGFLKSYLELQDVASITLQHCIECLTWWFMRILSIISETAFIS